MAYSHDGCRILSQSYKWLRLHLNEEHLIVGGGGVPYVRRVDLQGWYSESHKYVVCFIIAGEGPGHGDEWRRRFEAQEQMRLAALEQDGRDQQDDLGHSTNS